LFVIARNSTFAYRGTSVNVKQVSKELGVRHILEGSVRKAGNRIRVTAQLIDGVMGNTYGPRNMTVNCTIFFDLQDQITQKVVSALLTQIQVYTCEK